MIVNSHAVGIFKATTHRHDIRKFTIYSSPAESLSFLNHASSIGFLDIQGLADGLDANGLFVEEIHCKSARVEGRLGCALIKSLIKSSDPGGKGLVCKELTIVSDSVGFKCMAELLPRFHEVHFSVIIVPTQMHVCGAVFLNLLSSKDVWISPLGEFVVELMYALEIVAWQSLIGVVL